MLDRKGVLAHGGNLMCCVAVLSADGLLHAGQLNFGYHVGRRNRPDCRHRGTPGDRHWYVVLICIAVLHGLTLNGHDPPPILCQGSSSSQQGMQSAEPLAASPQHDLGQSACKMQHQCSLYT